MQTLLTKKHIIWEKKKNINKLRIYLKNLEKEGGEAKLWGKKQWRQNQKYLNYENSKSVK